MSEKIRLTEESYLLQKRVKNLSRTFLKWK